MAVGSYAGVLRRLIHEFKFKGRTQLVEPLAGMLAQAWASAESPGASPVLVPVPLHRGRERARGYNQSSLLARRTGELAGIQVKEDLLIKCRATRNQTDLRGQERRLNLKGAFALAQPAGAPLPRVILVDDVMTTGATLEACAQALREGGVASVEALVLGRVFPDSGGR